MLDDRMFQVVDRDVQFLLPPTVSDYVPADHLARFIVDTVATLDLSAIKSAYAGRGKAAYHPVVMVALLFYAYATGVFSSRRIEEACRDRLSFQFVTNGRVPDHDTIAYFRQRFGGELQALFVQILAVAVEVGALKLGRVSLDGTKIRANASKHKALSWQHAMRIETP